MDTNKLCSYIGHKKSGKLSVYSFNTDQSYNIPVAIMTSNVEEFQKALTFSAKLIELEKTLPEEYVKEILVADHIKQLEKKYSEDISRIERVQATDMLSRFANITESLSEKERYYTEQIKQIHSDYAQQIKRITRDKELVEENATAAKQEVEANLQKEIKQVKKLLAEKETEVQVLARGETFVREQCKIENDRIIQIINEKNSDALTALRESYQANIKIKEDALEQRESRVALREQELQTTIQRNASSSFRGQDGEMQFEQLAESTMKWKLTNTSKIPHSCDYSSEIHGSPVFFEIKNYTDPVRNDEVLKFHRDMKEHPEVAIGIFISWNTRIVGKDQALPFSIEWINDSQCAIYIQPLKELDINATLTLIDQTIKITGIYRKQIESKGDISESAILQPRIDKARIHIDQYISEASSSMKRIINDKKRYLDLIESTYSLNIASMKAQTTSISTALSILTGDYVEDTTIDPTLIAEPEPSKPKKQAKKL